jgi:hypothetical protein
MQNITSSTELKDAIQLLEVEQAVKRQLLNEQLRITFESLKPVNILKSTFKDIISSPSLPGNILNATIGLASGYLTKKIAVGFSSNIFRKLFGNVLQLGVTNVVAKNPDTIKSFGKFIVEHLARKKEKDINKSGE